MGTGIFGPPHPPRKPGESVRIINPAITPEQKRYRETRRRIEDMEAALRAKREEDAMREADW